ncbi:glucose-6-phosphate dehydrogenase [Pararobbsia alpina]|uniref:Glucose-6-phosphate 1-dehydrogenase n=1 Tax=Pararobbsia alpina TaxID=621374 RepID=A0A6S7BHP7_9BURK|nr:glucose-6-phosphate dehydrogenase (NADP(+)) [Pararobbsia alpina]CAB3791491.1 Glucose-6-phosphate 1-dehydrogenase 2 [Pararobbsia alpina]
MNVAEVQPASHSNNAPASREGATPAPPCTIVIFGARGDLTKRLLMPSIYNLVHAGLLDKRTSILGVDHNDLSSDDWRRMLSDTLGELAADPHAEFRADKVDPATWKWVTDRLEYLTADFDSDETYRKLNEKIQGNAVFYLAVSARFFGPVIERLGHAGLLEEKGAAGTAGSQGAVFRRVIIEKPFGSDLASACELNKRILAVADESQYYRIDHFLGKDAVQSLLAMRFANRFFEAAWRAESVDHVQISAVETIGVGSRGNFYETTGALRDMVPNHLFQLLSMTGIEAPTSLSAQAVRDAKTAFVKAAEAVKVEDIVRGQYAAGKIDGVAVKGYREEDKVASDSTTETYIALKLAIDTPRWKGVPFYLRTGKRLGGRFTEIAIHFKPEPYGLFAAASGHKAAGQGGAAQGRTPNAAAGQGCAPLRTGGQQVDPASNVLTIQIDPKHGAAATFNVKVPGPLSRIGEVESSFDFADFFGEQSNVGYESLIYECLLGDATLFQRADTIEASWAAVQPVIDLAAKGAQPESYAAGSAGPTGADTLLSRDGRAWTPIDKQAQ